MSSIHSALNILLHDSIYRKFTLVELTLKHDPSSKFQLSYHSDQPHAPEGMSSVNNTKQEIKNLRGRVVEFLQEKQSKIIIIDHQRGKIFTDAKSNGFLARVIENTGFKLYMIDQPISFEEIIKEAFPFPIAHPSASTPSQQKSEHECILQ